MTAAARLGRLFRREGSVIAIRNVRRHDDRRAERLGVTTDELQARFNRFTDSMEKRVQALEAEVLGG